MFIFFVSFFSFSNVSIIRAREKRGAGGLEITHSCTNTSLQFTQADDCLLETARNNFIINLLYDTIFSRASYFRNFREFKENREHMMHANITIKKNIEKIEQLRENKMRKKFKTENSRKYDAREKILSYSNNHDCWKRFVLLITLWVCLCVFIFHVPRVATRPFDVGSSNFHTMTSLWSSCAF